MGYSFYQTTRSGNKYVLKEKFVEFQEVSAINKYNKMFNDIISKKLAKHKTLEQAIDFLIWNVSIKKNGETYDLVPEYIDYIITDLFDIDSKEIRNYFEKAIKKHFKKNKSHYYRNLEYAK